MTITTYIIPITDSSIPALQQLIVRQQLRVSGEHLSGAKGTIYRPVDAVTASIAATSDHSLRLGTADLDVPVHRLPEWEYCLLVRSSAAFSQRRLVHLMPQLLRRRTPEEERSWTAALLDALLTPAVTGPVPLTVGDTWTTDGEFLPEQTRVIQQGRHAFLRLAFRVPLAACPPGRTVLGLDVGLDPLLTAAEVGGRTWNVGGVHPLTRDSRDHLYRNAHQAGVPSLELRRALNVLQYAACRMVIEDQALLQIQDGVRAVIAERLTHQSFRSNFISQARDLAVFDFLQAWLPQRLHAYGAQLIRVDPAYTSRDCSRCLTRTPRQVTVFRCPKCGHQTGVHENAARNIAARGLSLVRW